MARKKIPMTKLAWMAGVLETRGKIRRVENPKRATTQLILQVQSQNISVVERMCVLTGTEPWRAEARTIQSATTGGVDRRGCVEHCPEPHVHLAAYMPAMAKWAVTGAGAAIVLYNLEPFLDDRLNLAVVPEIIGQLPREGRGVAAVAQSMLRLTDLGWDLPPEMGDFNLARWRPAFLGRRPSRLAIEAGPAIGAPGPTP